MSDPSIGGFAATARVSQPLEGIALPESPGVASLRVGPPAGRLVLRADPPAATRLAAAIGLALAVPVNRAETGDGLAALRLGPDEWLLIADAERDPWLSARIAEAAADQPFALVDVSHRALTLVLEGQAVEAVLSAGCPLPLALADFPVDRATRTLLGKAEVVLWRRAAQRFHIEVAASFAPYVTAFLAHAIEVETAIAVQLARGQ